MLVQPQAQDAEEEEEDDIPTAPTPPSPINAPSPPLKDPTPTPHASPPSLPQEQPTTTSESSMTFLNTLLETYATLEEEEVKVFRSKEAKKGGKIEAIDADEDITLVDVEIQEEVADMDAELQGRITQEDVSAVATKDVCTAEPIVFDDEEVTITMDQTLIKMKAEKERLLDEQIAKRLHDDEVEKVAAKEKKEHDDLERAKVLQK
uniref:Uncharacterized protein n=1 Tax=Tanacetum cinerariifolium TaxID=118510 RepID=A0A699JKN3_TANCI|nr:hypothetical protein [Tanacetum cinerariifolium]